MRELRVLHLIQFLRGYGAEKQICDLLPHLQNDGVSVAALSVYGSRLTAEEQEALSFPIIDIGRKNRADYSFLPRMVAEIKRFSPDIVHAHTHSGKYWGRVAAWMAKVPCVVFTEHNPCDPRRSAIEHFADPLLHARTTRIVTFLDEQRRVLSERDRVRLEKIAVIPNGLAAPPAVHSRDDRKAVRRQLGVEPEDHAIFVIGRLEYQKNQELALRAIAETPEPDRKHVRLFLMGSGSLDNELRALARELQIEEHVRFLGYRHDVPDLLPAADVLLMTSHFEGMPLTLIEGMNAGIPIVTTPWTGASDMLGKGRYGFIIPGWTPQACSQELSRALASPSARSTVAERARAYAGEAFDIRRMAQAHKALYLDVHAAA